MVKGLEIGGLVVAVLCALVLMAGGASSAFGAAGTTMTPAEATLNAVLAAGTSAVFETPLGTVTCSESTSRGAVAERPENVYEEEEEEREETLERPGTVPATFGRPTFTRCSFPGASSVTVSDTAETDWSAAATGEAEEDIFAIEIPQEALRITIVNSHGTCTIISTEASSAEGTWTDGSGGSASTAELQADLEYSASGTCRVHCHLLEATGVLPARFTYAITNAAERGESIVF